MLIYSSWEPPKGFIPFATVRSQTAVAISSYLRRLKSCYQGLTGVITSSECFSDGHQNASLGTLLAPNAAGEQIRRG